MQPVYYCGNIRLGVAAGSHLNKLLSTITETSFINYIESLKPIVANSWLLQELNSLGFSVSLDEVARYKQPVTENETATDFLSTYLPGSVHTVDGR